MSLLTAGSQKTFPNVLQRISAFILKLKKPFKPHSLRFEIGILFSLLNGTILAFVCAGLYLIMSQTLYAELDNNLTLKAQGIKQALRSYVDVHGEDVQRLKEAVKTTIIKQDVNTKWWMSGFQRRWQGLLKDLNLGEEYINFASYQGSSLYRSPNMSPELTERFNAVIPPAKIRAAYFRDIVFNAQKLRIINFPFSYSNDLEFLIQVGVYPKPLTVLLANWIHSIMTAIPIIMVLTFFIGQLISMRILSPIRKLTLTARQITTQDLSERIEPRYYYSDMNSLVHEFNSMITRLENSFHHIEEFSAHVAHELKTPLTIIKGESELALLKDRDGREYRKAIKVTLEECEKMLKIIEDLLLLARMDYQPEAFDMKRVDLIELLREFVSQAGILARAKNLAIKFDADVDTFIIKADAAHLRRLFLNLIDNAIKFSPENGVITVNVARKDKAAHVSIQDRGPGIAPDKLDKIFERFYRADSQVKGSGLGLNIALMIARNHKGDITVNSRPEHGTTFTVSFPAA